MIRVNALTLIRYYELKAQWSHKNIFVSKRIPLINRVVVLQKFLQMWNEVIGLIPHVFLDANIYTGLEAIFLGEWIPGFR